MVQNGELYDFIRERVIFNFYNVAVKRICVPHYFILDKLFNSKAIHEVKILSIEIYFFDSNDNVFLF